MNIWDAKIVLKDDDGHYEEYKLDCGIFKLEGNILRIETYGPLMHTLETKIDLVKMELQHQCENCKMMKELNDRVNFLEKTNFFLEEEDDVQKEEVQRSMDQDDGSLSKALIREYLDETSKITSA